MPGIGAHPRGIHLWWARRPLAAARAVIFAQMVNDPSWKWELERPEEIPPNHLKASWAKSRGPAAYSEAIGVYLAFALDRSADFSNTCILVGSQEIRRS